MEEKIKKLKELTKMDLERIQMLPNDYLDFFNESLIFLKYEKSMKSYEKFENKKGWFHSLFHSTNVSVLKEDWENFKEWLNFVYQNEIMNHSFIKTGWVICEMVGSGYKVDTNTNKIYYCPLNDKGDLEIEEESLVEFLLEECIEVGLINKLNEFFNVKININDYLIVSLED